MLTFNAIDVETANADRASICQIGIVHVDSGTIADEWQTLLDPETWFDEFNVAIHGIRQEDVTGSPKLPSVRAELRRRLRGRVLVSHSSFDRTAFERAMQKYGLEQLEVIWLDSARVARRAWPHEFGDRGWSLKNVAYFLGLKFRHHDALEDARTAANIVLRACQHTGQDIAEWLQDVRQPIWRPGQKPDWTPPKPIRRAGAENGPLVGESVVFTGELSIPRQAAANLAASAGCSVANGVSRKTTMLVVGNLAGSLRYGRKKSTKYMKAEALIEQGSDIQILSENDFVGIVERGV